MGVATRNRQGWGAFQPGGLARRVLRGLLVALLLLLPAIAQATPGARTVSIGVYENAPKVFISESGQPAGIFIDLIEAIAKAEGWNLRYVPGTWAEGLDRLERGEIDLMPDVAFTAEREVLFSFHKVPVLSSWSQVYAPEGSEIHSILDLNGKRISVLEHSVQQTTFEQIAASFGLDIRLVYVADYKAMFEAVMAGKADAAVTNRFYGLMHAKASGLADTAVIFDPCVLFFAASLNDPGKLLDTLDTHLTAMKKNMGSTYYGSLKRWTSEDVRFTLPLWVWVLALVAGVIVLMSLLGSVILKKQVDLRTRELREINQEMEQRIIQRTEDLALARERAESADQLKSAFLASMSHELRTPLNSIIGFTGIMLKGLAGPLTPEQNKQLTMVQGSSRHLLSLINDVLDISKIEAGQLKLSPAAFDLVPSVEKMVGLLAPQAEQKGIALTLDISLDDGNITTDQRRLEQVLLNLLSNAVKFTEKGEVRVTCRREGEHLSLAIADTGIGMRTEDLPNLFQPFRQLDDGLARKYEGTGLGLSICKKLLTMMGGSIKVESALGQGSTFTVRLPMPHKPS